MTEFTIATDSHSDSTNHVQGLSNTPPSFDAYKKTSNFYTAHHRGDLFEAFVIEAAKKRKKSNLHVLDIGCGIGICRDRNRQRRIRAVASEYWGIEPDISVDNDGMFDKIWRTTLEDSDIEPGSVDVAYAAMVIEHITAPKAFLKKLYEILRPGGTFLFLTINKRSYLGRISSITSRLKMQDFVLKVAVGSKKVDEYHYPAVYLLNERHQIEQLAKCAGFKKVEFLFTDNHDSLVYWPRGMKWIGRTLDWKHQMFKEEEKFNNLFVKLEK